jgi:gamma-glutamyltranspeptidase/glutathione hydrolase
MLCGSKVGLALRARRKHAEIASAPCASESLSIMNSDRSLPRPGGSGFATRSVVHACHGMAATSQPLATETAVAMLRSGGSAVDAAIAANACLGLMEPVSCGIGGDLFAIVWDANTRRLWGLNASGRSPRGATTAMVQGRLAQLGAAALPTFGPMSVSVPGAVDGWAQLHAKFGRLAWSDVLTPAIAYAEEGFPVSEVIAGSWERNLRSCRDQPGFGDTFLVDAARAPRPAEIWRNPALAETYRRIARDGRDEFYRGETATRTAAWLEQHGSFLRADDFAAHTSDWVDPVSTNYRGHEVWELPPNGQGIAALQILNLLEGFDLAAMGFGSADYAHTFIEAKKLAFEDRARLYGDPAFAATPVERLISKDYAARRRALIDPRRAAAVYPPDPEFLAHGDTIYLCTADRDGTMVSLIQSNYMGIGSGVCPPGLGFGLQNRGMAFTFEPGHPNAHAPGKRPFHTIIPAFVTRDGAPLLAFGVMGGAMQPQGHAQIIVNLVDFGMNLQEAGDAPRICHSGSSEPTGSRMTDGGWSALESGYAEAVCADLRARGHDLRAATPELFGGYQAIRRDPITGVYSGASESRKDGHAAGF